MLNEKQLTNHYSSLGGSFAAAIMGYSKYTSPLDVYLLLTDEEFRRKNQEDVGNKLCVKLGNHLESFIADEVAAQKGWKMAAIEETIKHPQYDFLTAHPDRIIIGQQEITALQFNSDTQSWEDCKAIAGTREGLEIKARSAYKAHEYGEEGTDFILDEEMAQCQHYMNVTGLKKWHLAVLLGNTEIKVFPVDRNDEFIEIMQAEQIRFWNEHVLAKIPPQPRTAEEAAKLYPKSVFGTTLKATPEIEAAVIKANGGKERKKIAEQDIKEAKDTIACYMKDAETLLDSRGSVLATYKTQERKAYTVNATSFKTMLFKENTLILQALLSLSRESD